MKQTLLPLVSYCKRGVYTFTYNFISQQHIHFQSVKNYFLKKFDFSLQFQK